MSEIKKVPEVYSIPNKFPNENLQEGESSDKEKALPNDTEQDLIAEDGSSKVSELNQYAAVKKSELEKKLDQFMKTKKES